MLNRFRSEDGVVAVLVAILLPLLLAFSGYGLGLLLVAGGERELQRATDAAALAGAASLPLADLDYDYSADAAVRDAVCEVLEANLTVAQIANGFGAGEIPDCDNGQVGISRENELADLQAIQDLVTSVQSGLESEVRTIIGDEVCTPLVDAMPSVGVAPGGLLGTLTGAVDNVLQSSLGIVDPSLAELISAQILADYTYTVTIPLVGTLAFVDESALEAACGDFELPLDLRDLLPALVTPQVRVTVDHTLATPLGELLGQGSSDVASSSLARRRLKNVVLLPLANACPALGAAAGFLGVLGQDMSELYDHEDMCLIDPNEELAAPVGDALFDTLGGAGTLLEELAPGSGLGDRVDCLANALTQDLTDVYDPPGGGHVPTAGEVVQTAANLDEDVVVLVVGTVGSLQVPFLDMLVLPATQLLQGQLGEGSASLIEARGVFRASLLDEARDHTVFACL